MRATSQKKHSWKKKKILKLNCFFPECFFIHQNKMFFFRKSATIQCARWAEKNHAFFGNVRPKSNLRAHLKQRKKNIVALWW